MTKVKLSVIAFVFSFPSTTIRIHIRPNTAVNYSVFGRKLKTHIRYSPTLNAKFEKVGSKKFQLATLPEELAQHRNETSKHNKPVSYTHLTLPTNREV